MTNREIEKAIKFRIGMLKEAVEVPTQSDYLRTDREARLDELETLYEYIKGPLNDKS